MKYNRSFLLFATIELVVGATGEVIIGIKYSWWLALAIFLIMLSMNIHNDLNK